MHAEFQYICDVCGSSFPDKDSAMDHEATHFNLSPDEYRTWLRLRQDAAKCGHTVSHTKNRETDAAFDTACKNLTDFEQAHGLSGQTQPIPAP